MQSLSPGTLVADRYRLERKLGAGGMGSVWLAHDRSLDSLCAVKLVDPDKVADEEVRIRFQREAKAAAKIRCANVVDVFDHGIWSGVPFIVMEFLEGEDLGSRLDRVGKLAPNEVYEIVAQVARGLVRAHAAGIVHRDLKPENIFLVPGDDHEIAKVLDFGIAKHDAYSIADKTTKTGSFLGTPYYVSPEQARGKPIDWRSDLWSFAIIVFQCLTGRPPFESDALGELMGQIIYEPIPKISDRNPELPKALDAWWERAVARDRERRFQSAKEFADELAVAIGAPRLAVPSILPRSSMTSIHDFDRESQPPVLRVPTQLGIGIGSATPDRASLLDSPEEVSRGTDAPVSSTRRSVMPTLLATRLPQRFLRLPRKQQALVLGVGGAGLLAVLVLLIAGLWTTEPEAATVAAQPTVEAPRAPAPEPPPPAPAPTVSPAADPVPVPQPTPSASAKVEEPAKPKETVTKKKPAAKTPKPAPKPADTMPDYGI